ncbi:hypothetical protein [Desulfovibrio sp. Huiquan2017]|uniref:hypothetical protein n=1 Tax=Desulfovibrio sp. Huiquan2017 TaxID=2816861 RepID=UPI001A9282A7|nr:hypothetical protein [Desulfovibrio sp. Huiquan2017]
MNIDVTWLIVAVILSVLVGVVLHRWQRPVLPRLYVWITIIGTLFASYYILNVFFGTGRTGWP